MRKPEASRALVTCSADVVDHKDRWAVTAIWLVLKLSMRETSQLGEI
jgi:hypothetical protein